MRPLLRSEILDEARQRRERDGAVVLADRLGGIVADAALAADEQHADRTVLAPCRSCRARRQRAAGVGRRRSDERD